MKQYDTGFSFVIPTFNEEINIRACILSIITEMHRCRWFAFEIYVVDNGSTDLTAQIARDAGARVITETENGVVWARTRGAGAAAYSHIVNINADNTILPGWGDAAIEYLVRPTAAVISGPVEYTDIGKAARILAHGFYAVGKLAHRFVHPICQSGNCIIRHKSYDRMGGYDISGDDTMIAQRAQEVGNVLFDERLVMMSMGKRISEQGLLFTGWLYAINYFSVAFRKVPATQSYQDFH